MRFLPLLASATLGLAGCAIGSGVVPVGPGTFALSEMRAPVRGGGLEARRAVLATADSFCAGRGGSLVLLDLSPGGDPWTPYWPTAFNATFRCRPAALPPTR